MASKRGAAANAAAIVPTTPAPTSIALDLHKHAVITVMPLDVIRRATQLTADAESIVKIDSASAIETADMVASGMKALEVEIDENTKAQLRPIEDVLAAVKAEIKRVAGPLAEERHKLTERVVLAKQALGYEAATSCYASSKPKLRIMDASKIPRTVTIPGKDGKAETIELWTVNEAAVNRALKAGVHVPGVYQDSETIYGTRSK